MMGTFGGALEARQIDASDGKLTADVTRRGGAGRWRPGDPPDSRFHAPGCARRSNGEGRARAFNLCDELPPLPDPTQCDPAHLVRRLSECFGMTDDGFCHCVTIVAEHRHELRNRPRSLGQWPRAFSKIFSIG